MRSAAARQSVSLLPEVVGDEVLLGARPGGGSASAGAPIAALREARTAASTIRSRVASRCSVRVVGGKSYSIDKRNPAV